MDILKQMLLKWNPELTEHYHTAILNEIWIWIAIVLIDKKILNKLYNMSLVGCCIQ